MKNLGIGIFFLLTNFVYSQYCAGDQISTSDQNIEHIVGAAFGDYEVGEVFKLSDLNGDLNGGNYHITFIDMSASW